MQKLCKKKNAETLTDNGYVKLSINAFQEVEAIHDRHVHVS